MLFHQPRSRQHSIDEDAQSPHNSTTGEGDFQTFEGTGRDSDGNEYFQQQIESVVEMLLSMNPDLSAEAASDAAILGGGDANVAQFVIDGALSAPPVCRHMLNDGCYRSDCQFSHDVEGHTCLFWLRGRCGKRDTCRFRHGFSEQLLSGLNQGFLQEKQDDSESMSRALSSGISQAIPISSQRLVGHGVANAFTPHQEPPIYSPETRGGFLGTYSDRNTLFGNAAQVFQPQHSSWEPQPSVTPTTDQLNGAAPSFSFASVASKGYGNDSFARRSNVDKVLPVPPQTSQPPKTKFVKIPQDLWNPHINRNAGAFHIANPLDRYKEVSKSVARDDVIDLHFQSTKTFAVVLSSVLPQKLRDHNEIWVVTGSGHHVGRNTHQKGGGALESAVLSWLETEGHPFVRGKDRNGHGGAILVRR